VVWRTYSSSTESVSLTVHSEVARDASNQAIVTGLDLNITFFPSSILLEDTFMTCNTAGERRDHAPNPRNDIQAVYLWLKSISFNQCGWLEHMPREELFYFSSDPNGEIRIGDETLADICGTLAISTSPFIRSLYNESLGDILADIHSQSGCNESGTMFAECKGLPMFEAYSLGLKLNIYFGCKQIDHA
jgi:hypothetical protein